MLSSRLGGVAVPEERRSRACAAPRPPSSGRRPRGRSRAPAGTPRSPSPVARGSTGSCRAPTARSPRRAGRRSGGRCRAPSRGSARPMPSGSACASADRPSVGRPRTGTRRCSSALAISASSPMASQSVERLLVAAAPSGAISPCHQHVPPSASISLRAKTRVVARPRRRGHRLEPPPRLGEVAVLLPEPPHREREADRDRRVRLRRRPGRGRPGCRRARARAGRASAAGRRPTARRRPGRPAPRTSRDGGPGSSAVSPRPSSCSAAYSRIVSEQPEARLAVGRLLDLDQALVERAPSARRRCRRRVSDDGPQIASADVEVAAAGEHRQPVEQALRAVVEEVVAPGDRAAQRLLALGQVARRRRRAGRAGARAGPRIASGDRSLIRAAASSMASGMPWSRAQIAATAGRVLVGDGEARLDRDRALDEQAHRGVLARAPPGRRCATRRAWPAARARSGGSDRAARAGPGTGYSCSPDTCRAARLVTTTLMPGRGPQQVGDDRRRRDDLLEVVEHEQHASCRAASRRAARRSAGRRPPTTPTAPAIRGATSIGSRIGSSGTKKTPSGKSSETRRGELERQSRLAGAARARSGSAAESRRGGSPPRPAPRRDRRRWSAGSAGCWAGRRASAAAGTRTAARRRRPGPGGPAPAGP